MQQYLEFALNHPLLISAFVVTLGMVVFMEVQRVLRSGREVTPATAVQLQNQDGIFVDVRDVGEFRQGHLIEAKHIPLKELEGRVRELDKHKDRPIIAYCATGAQAAQACGLLGKHGFEQVYSIAGGMAAWEKANLPVER